MKTPFRMCQLTVIDADISGLLFNLNLLGVELHYLFRIDELTASFCIRQNQYDRAALLIEENGGKILRNVPASVSIWLRGIIHRPILVFGSVLLCFLTVFLPTRILFISVSGNQRIPYKQILDTAAECGIYFGVPRHEIRSENVKNRLLSSLPQLKWAGVNTSGCVARISVQERVPAEQKIDKPMVSSLVASCDGVVREMTVRNGNPICRVGQAVKKGQLLVSGYADCGRCIYGTRADAEIYALTSRNMRVSVITEGHKKGPLGSTRRKYGLVVGKKRINFYKGSGIYDTTCVRMYVEYPLTLPGGFQLPIAVSVQKEIDCTTVPNKVTCVQPEILLDQFARSYLETQMIAGKVIKGNYQLTESDGALHLAGQYICDEMIGQTHNEEIVNNYEQTD